MQALDTQTAAKYALLYTAETEPLVSISIDGVASINWPAIERKAAEWAETKDTNAAWSVAMLAARNSAQTE